MADTQTYEIFVLPKLRSDPEPDPNLLKLADKFHELRMNALLNAADAFASKYETESRDGVARSLHRLSNPKAMHLVAIKGNRAADNSAGHRDEVGKILTSEWVGLNVLLGPEEGTELSVPSANIDPFKQMTATASQTSPIHRPGELGELHFHINGMYVDPSARGAGLGMRLMDATLDRAKVEAAAAKVTLRVSLSVYSDNVAAKKLYEKSGFKILKEEKSRSRPEFVAIHMELVAPAE